MKCAEFLRLPCNRVYFLGYNNKEKVELSSLIESEGLQSQIAQQKEAASLEQNSNSMDVEETQKTNGFLENSMDCETNDVKSLKNMYMPGPSFDPALGGIPPAPPLPPQLMARLVFIFILILAYKCHQEFAVTLYA